MSRSRAIISPMPNVLETSKAESQMDIFQWLEDERHEMKWPRKIPSKVYVRFGLFSKGLRSFNHSKRKRERGLSVYNARIEEDGTVSLSVDDSTLKLNPLKCAAQLRGRLVWVVTGREVDKGSDGEPLLVRVRILPYRIRHDSIPAEIKSAATPSEGGLAPAAELSSSPK
jgi:hypothetical protein